MPDKLNFDDLTIIKAAFEVRFQDSLLIWDRAGAVWNETTSVLEGFKVTESNPNKVVLSRTTKSGMQLSLETARLGLVAIAPDKQLSELKDIATRFCLVA